MAERNKAEEIIDDSQLGEEVFELEFDDDDVEYYIVDEDDNEIGVCVKENGQLVEYLYEDEPESSAEGANPADVVKKQMNETAESIKTMKDELYKSKDDVQAVAKELKDAKDEIEGLLGDVKDSLKIFPSKKKKK